MKLGLKYIIRFKFIKKSENTKGNKTCSIFRNMYNMCYNIVNLIFHYLNCCNFKNLDKLDYLQRLYHWIKINLQITFFFLLAAWKIIKAWLPEDFVEKIKFVNKTSIQEYVSEDNLPVDMGGTVSIFHIYVYIYHKILLFLKNVTHVLKNQNLITLYNFNINIHI